MCPKFVIQCFLSGLVFAKLVFVTSGVHVPALHVLILCAMKFRMKFWLCSNFYIMY
jgi:hypothetical protein